MRDASGYCYGRTMGTKGLARRDVDLTALFYAVIAVSRTDGRTDVRGRLLNGKLFGENVSIPRESCSTPLLPHVRPSASAKMASRAPAKDEKSPSPSLPPSLPLDVRISRSALAAVAARRHLQSHSIHNPLNAGR